jgi:hypothetical protein
VRKCIRQQSELLRLKAASSSIPALSDSDTQTIIAKLIDANKASYNYNIEIKSKLTAESNNKLATLLDMGTVGLLGAQDFLTGDDLDMEGLMIGLLANGLNVMGSLQYIEAWNEETETLIKLNCIYVYDKLWEMPEEFGLKLKDDVILKIQESLDEFFSELRNEKSPQELRILVLGQIYNILFKLYMNRLVRQLERT